MAKKCRKCREKRMNTTNPLPRKPRGSIRKAKRAEMRKQKNVRMAAAKAAAQSTTEEPHKLSVELGGGKTVSQSVMSVIKLNVKPITERAEANSVERVNSPVPDVEIID